MRNRRGTQGGQTCNAVYRIDQDNKMTLWKKQDDKNMNTFITYLKNMRYVVWYRLSLCFMLPFTAIISQTWSSSRCSLKVSTGSSWCAEVDVRSSPFTPEGLSRSLNGLCPLLPPALYHSRKALLSPVTTWCPQTPVFSWWHLLMWTSLYLLPFNR